MQLPRVLIIEDNQAMRDMLQLVLRDQFTLATASGGEAALTLLRTAPFDLIVSDVEMPGMNGYEVAKHIRAIPSAQQTPIIFLTGRSHVEDRLTGFEVGASDFVSKPVDYRELKARIQAQLARGARPKATHEIEVGGLHLSTLTQAVSYFDQTSGQTVAVEVTPLELKLLACFMEAPEKVFGRDALLEIVWGKARNVSDRSVDIAISKLRQKLGSFGSLIQSVHGVGYRFRDPRQAPDAA